MKSFLFILSLLPIGMSVLAQQSAGNIAKPQQLFTSNEVSSFSKLKAPRTVQYWPEEEGIVCVDGQNRFTRALYGRCEAARLETSDYPEFGLYMPYMGGNLRFDIEHTQIRTVYDGVSRDYQIVLPAKYRKNAGEEALALISAYALQVPAAGGVWEVSGKNVKPGTVVQMRFGAATNASFSRNGDLGVDKKDCFDFTLERCLNNEYRIEGSQFTLHYGKGAKRGERDLFGQVSPRVRLQVVEDSDSQGRTVHYLTGSIPLDEPAVIAIGNATDTLCTLQTMLLESQSLASSLVSDFEVSTPDPFINPLEYVLPAAANGIWDE
ncbi:MAG: DUF4450 domain-containing protein, partial [Bacteroidales bacterium]|nr:DUF4450 domain-containing protein [Bacteroidales bacterium]